MKRRIIVACISALLTPVIGYAQSGIDKPHYQVEQIQVADGTQLQMDAWIDSRSPFSIILTDQSSLTSSSSLADSIAISPTFKVIIGATDVSSLFEFNQNTLRYSGAIALPSGEQNLTVMQLADAEWHVIGEQTIRVLSSLGSKEITHNLAIDVNVNGQLDENVSGDAFASEEPHFMNADARVAYSNDWQHKNFSLQTDATFLGVSDRTQGLRFFDRGEDTNKWDLSDYRMQMQFGKHSLEFGHTSFGRNSLLIDSLSRRGLRWQYDMSNRLSFGAAILSGNDIVGAQNLSGLSDMNDSFVRSAGVNFTAIEGERFGLQVGATYLDAQTPSIDDFTSASITSAEKNRGGGLAIELTDNEGRLAFDATWSVSRYENPLDAFDNDPLGVVEVAAKTAQAYSINLSYQLLSNYTAISDIPANMSVFARHRYVEPLYQTLTAFVEANIERSEFGAQFSFGNLNGNFGINKGNDNLDDIPTLLTTQTDEHTLSLALPLQGTIGESFWLPSLNYQFFNVHQFAKNNPLEEVSGFNDTSHLPDQVSKAHDLSAYWQAEQITVGWQTQVALQDNRQTGREQADIFSVNNRLNLDYQISMSNVVSFAINQQRQQDKEIDNLQYSRGVAIGFQFNGDTGWQASFNVSVSRDTNEQENSTSTNTNADIIVAKSLIDPLPWLSGSGQISIQIQHTESELINPFFDLLSDSSTTKALLSMNFSF